MRSSDRMVLAVTVAVILASFTLRQLSADPSYLPPAIALTVLLGAITLVLRRLHVVPAAVFAAQVLTLVGAVLFTAATLPPVRVDGFWSNLFSLIPAAAEHMRVQSAPMEPNVGVTFLLIIAVGAIAVMTDLMAATLHRVVWSLAPLATLYLVPALGLIGDVGSVNFILIALGYLGILIAEGMNSTGRWTRGLTHDSAQGIGSAEPVVVRAAMMIGIPALVLTLIAGVLVPTLNVAGWGSGGRGNQGPLQLTDPTADLRRNLNQPEDQVILRYQTDAPSGQYLRLASLPMFDERGFQNTQISVRSGPLPPPPGLSTDTEVTRTTTVQIGDVDLPSSYLLSPYAPSSFTADGDWVYDPNSLVIVSAERGGRQLRNMSYEVTSTEVAPDGNQLAQAGAGRPADAELTTSLPRDLPQSITDLAREVTRDQDTPGLRAAAIQAYLRSPQFTYSTDPQPGTGYDALTRFLMDDRTGYCEQFAAAMAVMARAVGIPTRFAVGFLPGEKVGDYWEVSVHDFHAWPELYFSGEGWVRYEPTPSVGVPPPWSVPNNNDGEGEPTDAPSASDSASSSTGPIETAAPTESTGPITSTTETTPAQIVTLVILLLAALIVLALLAAPAVMRVRLRRHRFGAAVSPAAQVEAAWSELRDTKVDLRSSWPAGSPRMIAREVGSDLDSADADAMGRLGTLVERARYSRTFDDADQVAEVPELAAQVRTALLAPHAWTRRLPATLAPRSLWVNLRTRLAGRRG